MGYVLAVNIGNTNISAAVVRSGRLVAKARVPTHSPAQYRTLFGKLLRAAKARRGDVTEAVIASVVPPALSRIEAHLRTAGIRNLTVLGRDAEVPIVNRHRRKGEVGQDRRVNAFAAASIYGAPCVIVSFGTAITFDTVSRKREHVCGLIAPGIAMSLWGLHRRTALLPKVGIAPASSIIGKDTADSMRGGVLIGFGAMCDALIARYRRLVGPRARVIATGGDAALMSRYAASVRVVDEDLTLKGLALLASR
jgi:type III pantothenate kinase